MKALDDSLFTEICNKCSHTNNENNINAATQTTNQIQLCLESINLKMWNYFSKPVLETFKSFYPKVTVIDYYGEEINYDGGKHTNYSGEKET